MSQSNSGAGTPKRPPEDDRGSEVKRFKTEPMDDVLLGGLFDPLPFETKEGMSGGDFSLRPGEKLDLPDFLSGNLDSQLLSGLKDGENTSSANSNLNTRASTPGGPGAPEPRHNTRSHSSHLARAASQNSVTVANTAQPPSVPSNQKGTNPQQYRAGTTQYPYKATARPEKKWHSAPMPATSGASNNSAADKDKNDPSKLNDALAAAGVDIQREEELLSSNYSRTTFNYQQQQIANRQRQSYGQLSAFLHPYHLAVFMNKVARGNGVQQNFMVDPEMLDFVSSACKEWLSNIVGKTAALARHRRRGIPAFNPKNGGAKQKTIPPSQRSEVSKELRNLALKQKEQEERRVAKRALLGLEKSDDVAPETSNKAGAEETLHRAANATAAMMTQNPSRKKYSWMTSGADSGVEDTKSSAKESKQSSLLSARGDNGLRFREIRTGNMITTKDLLGVLEDERMGTTKAVIKGYAKLKD